MKTAYQKTFDNYLSLQRVAPKTRSAYLQSVKGLTAYFQQPVEQLTNDQIQDYLLYCIQEKKLAWASCNVLFCGLKNSIMAFLDKIKPDFPFHRVRDLISSLTGNDVLLCPHCRQGTMTFHAQLYADSS